MTFDYAESGRQDDRWLYLPALRKVRRIATSDRGRSFVGTDFSYEDIKQGTKFAVEDYNFTTLGREEVDGHACFVLEAIPVSEQVKRELGYTKVKFWIDAKLWIPRKGEFWDKRDRFLKTVHTRGIREVEGIWTPHRYEAHNEQSGHKTFLDVLNTDYTPGFSEELFSERGMRRGL